MSPVCCAAICASGIYTVPKFRARSPVLRMHYVVDTHLMAQHWPLGMWCSAQHFIFLCNNSVELCEWCLSLTDSYLTLVQAGKYYKPFSSLILRHKLVHLSHLWVALCWLVGSLAGFHRDECAGFHRNLAYLLQITVILVNWVSGQWHSHIGTFGATAPPNYQGPLVRFVQIYLGEAGWRVDGDRCVIVLWMNSASLPILMAHTVYTRLKKVCWLIQQCA